MKKINQFQIGNIVIRQDRNVLYFPGQIAQNPERVILAMITVARYIKWVTDEVIESEKSNHCVSQSYTGRTIYVHHKEVMHICSTGRTDWCQVTRDQLISALKQSDNNPLIPVYWETVVPMLRVKRIEYHVEFDHEDFSRADERYIELIEKSCKTPGKYSFSFDEFKRETGLPTAGLVWHYLTNRHEFTLFNGNLEITSAIQNGDVIEITLQ